MGSPAERMATFEELYQAIRALPEGITGEILSAGAIETMGRPGRPHRRFARRLGTLLGSTVEEPDESSGWVIEPECEILFLGNRLLVPDMAGWRIDEADTAFLDANPVTRRPDWVCEILSDSTRKRDREKKLPIYAQAGVPYIWYVEPEERVIEVHAPRGGTAVRITEARASARVRLPPFDLEIALGGLWVPAHPTREK